MIVRGWWGENPHKWASVPNPGNSGGMAIIWDEEKLEVVEEEILKGAYTLTVICRTKQQKSDGPLLVFMAR